MRWLLMWHQEWTKMVGNQLMWGDQWQFSYNFWEDGIWERGIGKDGK
jgi:hypothetical protein